MIKNDATNMLLEILQGWITEEVLDDEPMNLQWIIALGARKVHFTPLLDLNPHSHPDYTSSVGTLREGTPHANLP